MEYYLAENLNELELESEGSKKKWNAEWEKQIPEKYT